MLLSKLETFSHHYFFCSSIWWSDNKNDNDSNKSGTFPAKCRKCTNQSIREISVKRGTIFDRNGTPLAISITGFDLFALSGLEKKDFEKLFQVIDLEKSFVDINTSKKEPIQKNLTFEEQREF